jgi:transposase
MHSAVDIIRTKRDGGEFSAEQIDWVVDAYTRGEVADEQMAALAMAILLRGMTSAETARWTHAMISSGERLDLTGLSRPTVDKHSTGGVGDKLTLPLAPLVAACGAAVPQLSGRGLGHTGGTLDKLEAIPGWRASVGRDEFRTQLAEVGAVICAAGGSLAPADQKERDVALRLLPIGLRGGETIVADKGYAGREFEQAVADRFGALLLHPRRADEPGKGPHLAPIRQCIESIFWTLKDRLGLEQHRARPLHGLRARIATKLLALAAGVWLNHYLDQPTRAFAALAA